MACLHNNRDTRGRCRVCRRASGREYYHRAKLPGSAALSKHGAYVDRCNHCGSKFGTLRELIAHKDGAHGAIFTEERSLMQSSGGWA